MLPKSTIPCNIQPSRGCLYARLPRLLLFQLFRLRLPQLHRLSRLIQPTQISLPANRDNTSENISILRQNERERKRRDGRPDFPAILPAHRNCINDSLLRLRERRPGKQRLHPEEVCVEYRRENRLVDHDFDGEGERVRGVVEVVAQEHEPPVRRD